MRLWYLSPVATGVLLGWLAVAARPVTIEPSDDGFAVRGAGYEANVGADGCFTRLQIAGAEFVVAAKDFPRGGYFYQGGILRLTQPDQPEPGVVAARSDKASVRYEFGPDSMTWHLTNLTKERMLYVMVLDPAIQAVRNPRGAWFKAPLERPWAQSTWVRDGGRVTIDGSTRLWGPWGNPPHQIWEVALLPEQTREVTFTLGAATAEEQAQAKEAATRVIEPPKDPDGPMWDLAAFAQAPAVHDAPGFDEPGVRALFYDGPAFEGRPTRVFAWLGLPEAKPGEKVPGMVLVHGGGGTAFAAWVKLWTSRGYAAIAMDTCGCVPRGAYANWERDENGGPPGWGGWGQIDDPREDQWAWHAVAGVLLAHSLLRAQPEVDPDRIGLTGISWGGYLASMVAGVDPRYKLAVPVYGCGFYDHTGIGGPLQNMKPEQAARWMRWWDPSAYLANAKMPMLWVTGSNDFAYWFPALQRSYRETAGPHTLCIRLRMPHGHGGPGENPEEIHAFADSILKGEPPLLTITGQGRDGGKVWATYDSAVPVVRAELNVTHDDAPNWPDRKWEALPAELPQPGRVEATLPDGVTVYYLNLIDQRDLVVSAEHEELHDGG